MSMQQVAEGQANPEIVINRNSQTLEHQSVYGQRQSAHSGLTWGYYGGRWGGNSVADGTLTLTNSTTNYVVVARATGVISVSTSNTNWNNNTDYARVYRITTAGGVVTNNSTTSDFDYRVGPFGVHGQSSASGGSVDADDVSYTPTTLADWDGSADPGDVEQALDQLAERVTDVETSGLGNSFTTIAVSGQSDVVADSATDTLTLVAGSNITITTNAGADTVTIAATAGSVATDAIWDVAGDLAYGTGSNTASRLAIGTARQKLRVNSGATAPEWASDVTVIPIACSDETTALTTGTAKVTFRMPFAMTLTDVRASVTTAPTGGTLLTVDVNESGTTILSTKLTFDASEKTTTTAATPRVISDSSLADDAEITIDIDAVGSTIAGAGLKVYLIGYVT